MGFVSVYPPDGLVSAFTINTPTRALDTNFQPSATRPAWVSYTVRILNPSSAASQIGRIELRSDSAATPTTNVGQARVAQDIGGLLSGGLIVGIDVQITAWIKAGDNVRLVDTDEAGAAVESIILSKEYIF